MTVPHPGYRIVEEVYIKYKYIVLCYYYAGGSSSLAPTVTGLNAL
jgi:hypothetical protein